MIHYKIAILGFGSIGRRHLINIESILEQRHVNYEIDLIRSGMGKEIDSEINNKVSHIYLPEDEISDRYDIIFITNPTYLHYNAIKTYAPRTQHMFIEKPIFHRSDLDVNGLGLKEGSIYYVACPLRYTKVIQYLKNQLDMSSVYSARAICSSYLPSWRPGTDYRKTYSAKKEQGGGVSIDLIHEWDYLSYLFGLPIECKNYNGRFSNLEIDSDDLSVYIAKYNNMLAEIHLDYFGKHNIRQLQLFTDRDTIIADLVESKIRFLHGNQEILLTETRDDYQRFEISNFFDIIEGKAINENDINFSLKVLSLAEGGSII